MKLEHQHKVEQLLENYNKLREEFKWENDMVRHLIALTYTIQDKELDTLAIDNMKDYIKSKTGLFSSYRGYMTFLLSGLLSAESKESMSQFDWMLEQEKELKDIGFKNSSYLPTALYTLSCVHEGNDVGTYCSKVESIYREMRENHPFLTGGDDYSLAILLGKTDYKMGQIEDYYEELHCNGFKKSNGLQMLSHILVFGNENKGVAAEKCEDISKYMKANNLRINHNYYAAIGLIALMNTSQEGILSEVVEVASFLREQKKYKSLAKGMNVLIAASIISSDYIHNKAEDKLETTVVGVSVQAIIAAQQAAVIAGMTATTAAAAGSAN